MSVKKKQISTGPRSTAPSNTKMSGERASHRPQKSPNKDDRNPLALSNKTLSVLMFTLSIGLFCLVLVKGENLWDLLQKVFLGLFGSAAILWPLLSLYISLALSATEPPVNFRLKLLLSAAVIVIFCTFVYVFGSGLTDMPNGYIKKLIFLYEQGTQRSGAGLVSGLVGILLVSAFGALGAKIIIFLLLFVSIMLVTGTSLVRLFVVLAHPVSAARTTMTARRRNSGPSVSKPKPARFADIDIPLEQGEPDNTTPNQDQGSSNAINSDPCVQLTEAIAQSTSPVSEEEQYTPPPISLLSGTTEPQSKDDITRELQQSGKMLVDTLDSFSVKTKIVNISRGPSVTRYEIQPASGVKISKITNLADDIALNLAACGVRIEAPIPGKSAVGIEIPNKIVSVVRMRELISSRDFCDSSSNLTVVLGRDITGSVRLADLAKMPHLLIAGSTGSGKSVCINSFIISLLYKSSPQSVRLLMIDPKMVELGIYNGIPHLLVPVVTDPRKAAGALGWAVTEMLRRYQLFAQNNVRDLVSYNKSILERTPDNPSEEPASPLPQIVIIIDELADLMVAAANEVEESICRLAQMARAAGMHLVIATQRPSVDVITGVIKANIPSRIALAVSSQIDSRTILDSSGAEKLLGRGDMLFSPIGSAKPIRVQGCYVTDSEIESIIEYIKSSGENEYDREILAQIEHHAITSDGNDPEECDFGSHDPMLKDAIECILSNGQASTSLLQRKLRLGYARAGRIMDQMEQMGIVGPKDGSKPREILRGAYDVENLN